MISFKIINQILTLTLLPLLWRNVWTTFRNQLNLL